MTAYFFVGASWDFEVTEIKHAAPNRASDVIQSSDISAKGWVFHESYAFVLNCQNIKSDLFATM